MKELKWYALYAVLTWLLSPVWGAMGVAIAFSSTEVLFHPLLFWMYGFKRFKYRRIFPEIFVGAGFIGLLWIWSQRSFLAAFLCSVFYLIVWFARNSKVLTSAGKSLNLRDWQHSAQNLILPANRRTT